MKVGNDTCYNDNLLACGLWTVDDLYKDGKLIPYDEWKNVVLYQTVIWHGEVS